MNNNYILRSRDDLLEELRILGMKKKKLDEQYRISVQDITADVHVINLEIQLLESLGRNSNPKLLGSS
jgi:hypothetical protein